MKSRRLFIALKPPADLAEAVAAFQKTLMAQERDLRWAHDLGLHLTLVFLGPVDADGENQVVQALDKVLAGRPPLAIQLGSLGTFGPKDSPRVLHLEIKEAGSAPLLDLQKDLEAALGDLGFDSEKRPYHPHLTLARARQREGSTEMAVMQKENPAPLFPDWQVEAVVVFESETHPAGARYTLRHSIPLPMRPS
jgi:2'-5' RNA ligase